jgi:indolepyruvate ferredoxin oxidoreductase alpha subunit
MMQEAFRISEKFNTPVIIRETRRFSQQVETFPISDDPSETVDLGLHREPWRFVPVPLNVVDKHRNLHKTIEDLKEWANASPFNKGTGNGTKGIVAAGYAFEKACDAIGDENTGKFRLLKLGILNPLPDKIIIQFLSECQEVLVVEENEPYIEIQIKAIAHDSDCSTRILGKQSSDISREGELFRWQIQQALAKFEPEFSPRHKYLKENETEERPKKKDHCIECQYDKILDALEEAAASLGQRPVLAGDPGCLVTVADRLDAKYAIGSAVAVADGLSKAGIEERAVAIFGDSAFFHSALPAICNAVHNQSNILIVVLDNKATATSGFQPNPGVDKNAMGQDAPALDIEQIASACGVQHILRHSPDELESQLKDKIKKALLLPHLVLLIVEIKTKP